MKAGHRPLSVIVPTAKNALGTGTFGKRDNSIKMFTSTFEKYPCSGLLWAVTIDSCLLYQTSVQFRTKYVASASRYLKSL